MSVLCYHTVEPEWWSPLAVKPGHFERHCAWLSRHRRVLRLSEGLAALDETGRLPRGTALITFDDGFSGVYEHALPVLRRFELPATIFLVAETLTPDGHPIDWAPTAPSRARTLTLDEVLEMQELGVTFGSHGLRHLDLTQLGDECERDLRASRELLEDLLHRQIRTLAYPGGLHNGRVRAAAHRAGFSHAFSLPEGAEVMNHLAIPRAVIVPGNRLTTLRGKCSRWYPAMKRSPMYPALRAGARVAGLGLRVGPPRGVDGA